MHFLSGKLSKADSFRLGTIGKVYPHDCEILILLLEDAFKQMGVPLPLTGDEM
jgi:aspartate aminotransferase-like enzyme